MSKNSSVSYDEFKATVGDYLLLGSDSERVSLHWTLRSLASVVYNDHLLFQSTVLLQVEERSLPWDPWLVLQPLDVGLGMVRLSDKWLDKLLSDRSWPGTLTVYSD